VGTLRNLAVSRCSFPTDARDPPRRDCRMLIPHSSQPEKFPTSGNCVECSSWKRFEFGSRLRLSSRYKPHDPLAAEFIRTFRESNFHGRFYVDRYDALKAEGRKYARGGVDGNMGFRKYDRIRCVFLCARCVVMCRMWPMFRYVPE